VLTTYVHSIIWMYAPNYTLLSTCKSVIRAEKNNEVRTSEGLGPSILPLQVVERAPSRHVESLRWDRGDRSFLAVNPHPPGGASSAGPVDDARSSAHHHLSGRQAPSRRWFEPPRWTCSTARSRHERRDAGGGGDDDMCLGAPCASRPILLGTHKQHIVVFWSSL
jgi:hypothetical protein